MDSSFSLLCREDLINWQKHLLNHQRLLFQKKSLVGNKQLLEESAYDLNSIYNYAASLSLLSITPQKLNFWHWPKNICYGPAIYFVTDRPPHLDSSILLYIGETSQAEKRWKGNHSCKEYLASYSEAIYKVKLQENLSIRFWTDVPEDIKKRRFIEEILIDLWRPGFNKVIQRHWYNPFFS